MTKTFTFITAFIISLSLQAQNRFILDFGSTHEKALEKIEQRGLTLTSNEPTVIEAHNNYLNIDYYFNEGGLYKIEIVKKYTKLKDATLGYDTYEQSFEFKGWRVDEEIDDKKQKSLSATNDLNLTNLKLDHVEGAYQLSLSVSSLRFAPDNQKIELSTAYNEVNQ